MTLGLGALLGPSADSDCDACPVCVSGGPAGQAEMSASVGSCVRLPDIIFVDSGGPSLLLAFAVVVALRLGAFGAADFVEPRSASRTGQKRAFAGWFPPQLAHV